MTAAERHAEVLRRLDSDDAFYCRAALRIVTKTGELVPFEVRPAQQRFFDALRQQRDAGLPERAIVLKARQLGISTATQATLIRRVTRRANHRALVVAHDNDTAGSLFDIGELMVTYLPAEIRPEIASRRKALGQKYLLFGKRAREAREAGDIGLNSSIQIDTAKEASGGRGKTYMSMHLSEVAFWEQVDKMTGLLNTVPDEPGTLIVKESTANGMNHFKEDWDAAEAGDSGYIAFFIPWWEEEAYRLAFASEAARAEFVAQVGRGPLGEDEPRLIELFGCTPEQLNWRRRTIVARCEGSIDKWNAEYPASAEDAFVATGRTVFSKVYIQRAIARAERTDPLAEEGLLTVGVQRERLLGGDRLLVPASAIWTPRSATGFRDDHGWWRVWEHPRPQSSVAAERERLDAGQITLEEFDRRVGGLETDGQEAIIPAGQYVIAVDVAGGEENTAGRGDWHVIEVIDHRTLLQVAEYRSREDTDQLALQALLAGYFWNEALVGVETTGSHGVPVLKDYLHRRYGYRRLYRRTPAVLITDRPEPILGWDTNRRTKPELIAGFAELLREGTDGVRSLGLAREVLTYVRDSAGRSGAAHGQHDDRLMAYMIAQQLARIHRVRQRRPGSSRAFSTVQPRNPKTGY